MHPTLVSSSRHIYKNYDLDIEGACQLMETPTIQTTSEREMFVHVTRIDSVTRSLFVEEYDLANH